MIGFFSGLGLGFWLVFGSVAYPPPGKAFPVSTEECLTNVNDTYPFTTSLPKVTLSSDMTALPTYGDSRPDIASFYGISVVWYAMLTCLVTLIVGYLSSFILGKFRLKFQIPGFKSSN